MSEDQAPSVKAQYAAQVAADLQRNAEAQERVAAEVASLDAQLQVLRQDQVLLLSVQRALDDEAADTTAEGEVAQVPEQRSGTSRSARSPRRKAVASRPGKGSAAGTSPKVRGRSGGPTLVSLVGGFLGQNSGPHSAAEITAALAQGHPDRDIKATAVRNAVEGLVAKGQAGRTRQGSSVFYTPAKDKPADAPEPVTA